MITIENLTLEFDVEGGSEEEAFAVLFRKHITQWKRHDDETKQRERMAAASRHVVGRAPDGEA
jgi:hypothetical protein